MSKNIHIVNALMPVADAFAGTIATDIINLKNWKYMNFIIQCGAGALGTSTITIEACDDATPTHTTPIPFYYQECVSGDTFGAIQQASVTGFATAAGANKMYKIIIEAKMLAITGYNYVRLKAVEATNDPVTASILAVLFDGRYDGEMPTTAVV
jgi:hypothetical protein